MEQKKYNLKAIFTLSNVNSLKNFYYITLFDAKHQFSIQWITLQIRQLTPYGITYVSYEIFSLQSCLTIPLSSHSNLVWLSLYLSGGGEREDQQQHGQLGAGDGQRWGRV